MGLVKRYCMLEAIRTAAIDETTVRLVVNCGTKRVVLESAGSDEDTRHVQVTIRCEEEDLNGCAITKEIETSTVIEDRSIDPRRSTRLRSVPAERDTQGIRNLDSTCYGICVLYTLVSLMKLYPELLTSKN